MTEIGFVYRSANHMCLQRFYPKIVLLVSRSQKNAMIAFRKSLKESAKIGRHRRNILNILRLIIAWLAETAGICTLIIGKFILRNENSLATLYLQLTTNSIFFVIVPAIYLVDTDNIIKSSWFPLILNAFGCQYKKSRVGDNESES